MNDTIAAISTSLGVGAISIIRISGSKSIEIVNKIFSKDLKLKKSHTITHGFILENKKKIDEVLVSIMLAPNTFTKEDVVEINTHGGIATTNKVLELLLTNGARLAEPGEFTKRAFLNGRIDLVEAEGVMDLINAKTEKARNLAINQVDGEVSNLIQKLRNDILKIIGNIEVNIDYPEYNDVEVVTNNKIKANIEDIESQLKEILNKSKNGKIIKEGIKTIIIGSPNVGKSSILNRLLNEDKAIVTDIAGTTRDIVEGQIVVDGVLLDIIDTAGIRKTEDKVESIGVQKSINLIYNADLILFVLNNNERIKEEELEILEKIKNKNHLIIINKIDLDTKLDPSKIINSIKVSAKNNEGIEKIKKEIKKMFDLEKIETNDMTYLSSSRSISLVKKSLEILNSIKKALDENLPIDMVEIDIRKLWETLGEIIGETYDEELLDHIFKNFCLGK